MLSLCLSFLLLNKHPNVVKHSSRRLSREQIKKLLLHSFVYKENINKEELSAQVDTMEDSQEAIKIIQEFENVITTNKKNIVLFAYE